MENLHQMTQYRTFDGQLAWLMRTQLDEEKLLLARWQIHAHLQQILKPHFPQGEILPYGSCESGLAIKESDLDFLFHETGNLYNDNEYQRLSKKITDILLMKTFHKVKNILSAYPTNFEKLIPIPTANVPVINFTHRPTNTECDISFGLSFGIFDTKWIKFCLTLDSRIKPLIIIIKCWAKQKNLYGKGMISNYSLVLIIFFYLQQPNIRLIPSVINLQNGVNQMLYRGCKVNFNQNYPSTSSNCFKGIPELLRGFFEFYSKFPFGNAVICLSDGTAPTKSIVQMRKNSGSLFPGLEKFACLQGPFELENNVLSGWTESLVARFQVSCEKTARIIRISEESSILMGVFQRT